MDPTSTRRSQRAGSAGVVIIVLCQCCGGKDEGENDELEEMHGLDVYDCLDAYNAR